MRPCDRARCLAPPRPAPCVCNLQTSIPTSPAAARGGATRCRVAPDICRKSMLQGGIVYAKRLPKLATCNNLCRFGWDFSHDLTAICMEIKVEAATKAHGNVSAAMGFMAPAASVSAQTAAECGRRIWPGLAHKKCGFPKKKIDTRASCENKVYKATMSALPTYSTPATDLVSLPPHK